MKRNLKIRALSALLSAAMVLGSMPLQAVPVYAALSDNVTEEQTENLTENQEADQAEELDEAKSLDVQTPYNATVDTTIELEGTPAAYKMINERFEAAGIMYKEIGPGKAQVIGVTGEETDIVIPNEVTRENADGSKEKYDEITIASEAFYDNDKLLSVEIQESIAAIEDSMFESCGNLSSVVLPTGVKWIGDEAFKDCKKLTRVKGLSAVETIGESAFANCINLKEIDTSNKLKRVNDEAFAGCSRLQGIELSEAMSIGEWAFAGCSQISSIDLSNVASLGTGAFSDCSKLVAAEGIENFEKIPAYAFANAKSLTGIDLSGAVEIGDSAFKGCRKLVVSSLVNVKNIGASAFYGCTSIKTISMGQNLSQIGNEAFYNCINLTKVEILTKTESKESADTILEIGDYAFCGCDKLSAVTLGTVKTVIGDRTFAGCSELEEVENSNYIVEIGSGAFAACTNLKQFDLGAGIDLEKPKSDTTIFDKGVLETIGEYAFENCKNLVYVIFPNSVESIGNGAFNVEGEESIGSIPCYTASENIRDLLLDSSVGAWMEINGDSFSTEYGNNWLDTDPSSTMLNYRIVDDGEVVASLGYTNDLPSEPMELVIPSKVYEWEYDYDEGEYVKTQNAYNVVGIESTDGGYGYSLCELGFNSLIISEGIEYIDDGVFSEYGIDWEYLDSTYENYRLRNVTLPRTIDRIGKDAFRGCEYLQNVYFNSNQSSLVIDENAFEGCVRLEEVGLPENTRKIGARAFSNCTGLSQFHIGLMEMSLGDENELIIGEEAFKNCSKLGYDGYFELPYNMTELGDGAFEGTGLTYVGIPYGIEVIGERVFKDCTNLYEVILGTDYVNDVSEISVSEIGASAFENCEKLQHISNGQDGSDLFEILEGIETIGSRAFYGCDGISNLKFSTTLTEIGDEAFANCSGIIAVKIPLGLNEDGSAWFRNCTALKDVVLPTGLKEIGSSMFEDCIKLKNIVLPETLEVIGNRAFCGTGLENITIPNSVIHIGEEAFAECGDLAYVWIGNGLSSVGGRAFDKKALLETESSKVQLVLVEYLDRELIPDAYWDGSAGTGLAVEPGAIVTMYGNSISGVIGENAQVIIPEDPEGKAVVVKESLLLEKNATLIVEGTLDLNGVNIAGKTEDGEYCYLELKGKLTGSGSIASNVIISTKLSNCQIVINDKDVIYAGTATANPKITVGIGSSAENLIYTYSSSAYACTYNVKGAGSNTVVITPVEGGDLTGSAVTKSYNVAKFNQVKVKGSANPTGDTIKFEATVTKVDPTFDSREKVTFISEDGKLKHSAWMADGNSGKVEFDWSGFYNGDYKFQIIYSGDENHEEAKSDWISVTVSESTLGDKAPAGGSADDDSSDGNDNSTGGSGGGGGSAGGVGGSESISPTANSEHEVETLYEDPKKGIVSASRGILLRHNDERYSEWELDQLSALIWGGSKDNYWKFRYKDGTYAKGNVVTDANGQTRENYFWEFINGRWWAFDSNGYAKMGWLYDPNYEGWFYIHVAHGMQMEWIFVGNQWYYMEPDVARCEGKMYAAQWTPDGYYVKEDGAWDGQPQAQKVDLWAGSAN